MTDIYCSIWISLILTNFRIYFYTIKIKWISGDRCLSGYKKDSDGFCFRLSGERVSWQTAFNNCKLDGAILVKVDTSKKQRFLTEIANKNES